MTPRSSRDRGAGEGPMLWRVRALVGDGIAATDGTIGDVADFLFEDDSWTVRHIVVDTGRWLPGRRVLLSPISVREVDPVDGQLAVSLTRRQVKEAPDVDTDRPVSRQYEIEIYRHYGYPFYWSGPYRWGPAADPSGLTRGEFPAGGQLTEASHDARDADPHLRSAREVHGYHLHATDGELGHVEDFLVDDAAWAIRYLVVDPRNWWPGKHVLVSTEWITAVRWGESRVEVDVSRAQVRSAPEYDARGTFDRAEERRLHAHYGRPGYWDRRPEAWTFWPPAA